MMDEGGASRNPSEHPALQHVNSGEGQVLFRATAESQNTAVTGHLYPVKQRLIFQNQCYGSTRVLNDYEAPPGDQLR